MQNEQDLLVLELEGVIAFHEQQAGVLQTYVEYLEQENTRLQGFTLSLAERVHLQHEILARRVEKPSP